MSNVVMLETVGQFKKGCRYRITEKDWFGRDLYELDSCSESQAEPVNISTFNRLLNFLFPGKSHSDEWVPGSSFSRV